MEKTVRIVKVDAPHKEVARAHVDADDNVTYSTDGEDIFSSLFDKVKDRYNVKENLKAARILNRDGWSNGYLMVAREER